MDGRQRFYCWCAPFAIVVISVATWSEAGVLYPSPTAHSVVGRIIAATDGQPSGPHLLLDFRATPAVVMVRTSPDEMAAARAAPADISDADPAAFSIERDLLDSGLEAALLEAPTGFAWSPGIAPEESKPVVLVPPPPAWQTGMAGLIGLALFLGFRRVRRWI